MALEIEGTIKQKMNVQSGTSQRGDWSKQEFVVEYQDGNYPTLLCLNVWGADKVNELASHQVGDRVKISFRPSSREYNGRWYTDLRAWRIESVQNAAPETYSAEFAPTQAQGTGSANAPSQAEAASTAHGITTEAPAASAGEENDLPF